jgi:hypothetical protein
VPFEETLAKELSVYLRERCLISPASEDSWLLVQPNGSPFGRTIVSSRITILLRQAGMKPRRGRVGPRPYDTRHSFAVNRLTEWYREGVDVQERLAWLSAYLGHDDLLFVSGLGELEEPPALHRSFPVMRKPFTVWQLLRGAKAAIARFYLDARSKGLVFGENRVPQLS